MGEKGEKELEKELTGLTGLDTRPCSKRQANSTKVLPIYKEKLSKNPQNHPTPNK